MKNEIPISPLKDLYELLGDSRKGYTEAAVKVESTPIGNFLNKLSDERSVMQRELGAALRPYLKPDESLDDSTLKGDVHRAWIAIRESLASSEDNAVLDECERGEDYLLKRFETILDDKSGEIPAELRHQLMQMKAQVQNSISAIRQLRTKEKAA